MENQKFYYDNKIVKLFILATMVWGVVGILVGLVAALQLAFPVFNFGLEFTTFGLFLLLLETPFLQVSIIRCKNC